MNTPSVPVDALALDPEATQVDALARDVLRENYLQFTLKSIEIKEDFSEGRVSLVATLGRGAAGDTTEIRGSGVGLIDGFFDGMMKAFSTEYPSLKTLSVADFAVSSGFDDARGRRSDALALAELRIRNSEGTEFVFRHKTPSVTRSSVRAALDALTFFINSERAYIQLHLALRDAKERRRSDLVERFQSQMSTLVGATSYSEVIERLRSEPSV